MAMDKSSAPAKPPTPSPVPPPAPRLGPLPSPTSRVMPHGGRLLWLPTGPVTLPGLRRVRVDVVSLAHPHRGEAKGGSLPSPRSIRSRSVHSAGAQAVHVPQHLPIGLSPRSPSGACAEVVRNALKGRLTATELEVAGAKLAERISFQQLPATYRLDVHLAIVLQSLDDDGDLSPHRAPALGAFLRGLCTASPGAAPRYADAVVAFVTDLLGAPATRACADRFDREEIGFAELYMAAVPIAAFATANSPAAAAQLLQVALVRPADACADDWAELPAETWTQVVHVLMQPEGDRAARRDALAQALVDTAASGQTGSDVCGFGMAGLGPQELATARAILDRCLRAGLDPLNLGLLAWGLQISPVRIDEGQRPADSRREIEGLHNTRILCASWADESFRVDAALEALMQAATTAKGQIDLLRGVLAARAHSARALQDFTDKQRTAISLRHERDPGWTFDEAMTLKAQFDEALPATIARLAPHCTPGGLMELAHRLALGEARPMPRWRMLAVCSTVIPSSADDDAPVIETKASTPGKAVTTATRPLEDAVRSGLALAPNDAVTVSGLTGLDTSEKLELLEAAGHWTGVSVTRMERMLADLEAGKHAKVAPALRAAILYRIVQRNLMTVTSQLLDRARKCFLADHAEPDAAHAQFARLAQAWQRAHGPAAVPVVQQDAAVATITSSTTTSSSSSTTTGASSPSPG